MFSSHTPNHGDLSDEDRLTAIEAMFEKSFKPMAFASSELLTNLRPDVHWLLKLAKKANELQDEVDRLRAIIAEPPNPEMDEMGKRSQAAIDAWLESSRRTKTVFDKDRFPPLAGSSKKD